MNDVCVHIRISGRVQGVGFRYFALEWAEKLGLVGWVRNDGDGSVESEVEGSRSLVEEYIKQLNIGPRWGHVSQAQVNYKPYEGRYKQFSIKR
jgi:acylphosphatase